MTRCQDCKEPTKSRVETCGPDTKMRTVVTYTCDCDDCEVRAAEAAIAAALAGVDKQSAKKPAAKKTAAKRGKK